MFIYYESESESEVAQSYSTLCNPIDCSLPGSSVHGIFQAIVLEWIAISFSSGSSRRRDRTRVSCIVDRRFTVWATYTPPNDGRYKIPSAYNLASAVSRPPKSCLHSPIMATSPLLTPAQNFHLLLTPVRLFILERTFLQEAFSAFWRGCFLWSPSPGESYRKEGKGTFLEGVCLLGPEFLIINGDSSPMDVPAVT